MRGEGGTYTFLFVSNGCLFDGDDFASCSVASTEYSSTNSHINIQGQSQEERVGEERALARRFPARSSPGCHTPVRAYEGE